MLRILGDDQHKGMDNWLPIRASIDLQAAFYLFVQTYTVIQLFTIQLLRRILLRMEIAPCNNGWDFHIHPIVQGMGQGILIYHVLEGNRSCTFLNLRRSSQLHTENRLQLIDNIKATLGPIMMALVHKHAKIGQVLEIRIVRFSQHLRKALDARWQTALFRLALLVQLGNVEHTDRNIADADAGLVELPIVVPIDDARRIDKAIQSTEDILGVARLPKVVNQLLIDSQIRRNDKKVLDALLINQIGNAGSHQARFADTCSKRKAKRRERPFEAAHGRKHGVYGAKLRIHVRRL